MTKNSWVTPNTFFDMINKIFSRQIWQPKVGDWKIWLLSLMIGKLGNWKFFIAKNGSTKKFRSLKKWSMSILTMLIKFISLHMIKMFLKNKLLGLFMIEVPKKGKTTQGLLWGYFLQITFTWNKFKWEKLNSSI